MKIAIITHYYGSKNYGGNLQAYALCKVLNQMGMQAEQISFERYSNKKGSKITAKKIAKNILRILSRLKNKSISEDLKKRNASLDSFNRNVVPHTTTVYDEKSIFQCAENYDVFITGSDQVWHPVAYCPAYGLEFVPSDKIKLSYAASMATDKITDEYRNVLKKSLSDFKGISVREISAVDLLQDIVNTEIHVLVDPVFLLSRDNWDELCSKYTVDSPYIFAYFLGDNKSSRILTEQYAKKHNLKVVTLPHLSGDYRKCDADFGNERLYGVSPEDFISLIKGAHKVFTDSFHAVVFSIIYEQEFVVFNRATGGIGGAMKTRLSCLLDTFHLSDRFCDFSEKNRIEYIDSLSKIDFKPIKTILEGLKSDSIEYLKKIILESSYEDQST